MCDLRKTNRSKTGGQTTKKGKQNIDWWKDIVSSLSRCKFSIAYRIWFLLSHHSSSFHTLTCFCTQKIFHFNSLSLFFLHQLIMTAAGTGRYLTAFIFSFCSEQNAVNSNLHKFVYVTVTFYHAANIQLVGWKCKCIPENVYAFLTMMMSIKKGEEERSQYPVILIEQALSIKNLLFRELFRFILKELRIKNDFVLPRRSCL